MYCVYVHIFPNGKVYVGVTGDIPERRWGANGCNYKNPYIKNAIKKYGWQNIKHEIICDGLTMEQASDMEIEMIKKFNSANRMFGYNISFGGIKEKICSEETKRKLRNFNTGKILSEETKKKISEYQKGQKRSEETRKRMSKAQKINFNNGNNAMHSPQVRKKVAQKLKGKKFPKWILEKATKAKYHPVMNINTGVIYQSIKSACDETGLNRTTIIRQCTGKTKKKEWKYVKEFIG